MSKLYSLWSGDGNDRQEFYRVKAKDIDQVITWVTNTDNDQVLNLKDFTTDQLIQDIDFQSESQAYIMLNSCLECDNYNVKKMGPKRSSKCEYCEQSTSYIEINEIMNPQEEDFSFRVIYPYGQDNYIDLTQGRN